MAFEDHYQFPNVTSEEKVAEYEASKDVFLSLLYEVKELSKKKPDATMNAGKVKIVNRVLNNLLFVLEDQADAKYLEALADDDLPQVSDAVLVMVQFDSALTSFKRKHFSQVSGEGLRWITYELIERLKTKFSEFEKSQGYD